jgi:hypothetical protein
MDDTAHASRLAGGEQRRRSFLMDAAEGIAWAGLQRPRAVHDGVHALQMR